ncbi:MAG: hypothetical protein E2576_02650 [Alcaligenaceae bacterium]|nr:hypothetical protein [Alcaligenaceae bacterium SAGV5]MPS55006.1 hypothetical protein [Alcaligenaceae bacterium SAGV3]MPT55600.1 hypothetical protein [Alcaligenaceae bacterium]
MDTANHPYFFPVASPAVAAGDVPNGNECRRGEFSTNMTTSMRPAIAAPIARIGLRSQLIMSENGHRGGSMRDGKNPWPL